MKLSRKFVAGLLPVGVLSLGALQAQAAVDSAVTTALTTASTDAGAVAALVVLVVVAIFGFRAIKRAIG